MFPHTSHPAQEVSSVRLLPFHQSDSHPSDQWPLRTFIELGALPSAVPCARLHARQVLWEWGLNSLIDTIELVVSELVTNALRACEALIASRYDGHWAPGKPPIRLWLFSDRKQVLIQVWDASDLVPQPQPQHEELDAENGRGLLLVTCLSTAWGIYHIEQSSGKIIWATVD